MKTLSFSYDQALQALQEAVAERGEDFLYADKFGPECRNFDLEGRPCCIAGVVYAKMGADQDFRREYATYTVGYIQELGGLNIDFATRTLLQTAQYQQDSGARWGAALEEAKKAVNDPAGCTFAVV